MFCEKSSEADAAQTARQPSHRPVSNQYSKGLQGLLAKPLGLVSKIEGQAA